MRPLTWRAAARREWQAAERIPYVAHVVPAVVLTRTGDYLQVIRLSGAAFETNDAGQLNNWHERLKIL